MIEALILYSMLMLTLFAWCGVFGVIFAATWVVQRVSWGMLVIMVLVCGYIIWRLN